MSPIRCSTADLIQTLQDPIPLQKLYPLPRKQKRSEEAGLPSLRVQEQPHTKRPRTWPPRYTAEEGAASDTSESSPDPLQYWVRNGRWRKEYFEKDSQVRNVLKGQVSGSIRTKELVKRAFLKEPFRSMHRFDHTPRLVVWTTPRGVDHFGCTPRLGLELLFALAPFQGRMAEGEKKSIRSSGGAEKEEDEDEAWEELLITDGFGGMLRRGLQVPRSLKAFLHSDAITRRSQVNLRSWLPFNVSIICYFTTDKHSERGS